jgi:integrase/recombinase XerD
MNWKQALTDYVNYLKLERGLADNSIKSYRRDIRKLVDFIEDSGAGKSPLNIDRTTLEEFVHQIAGTLQPRSQA